jgi:glutathione synthase/RimK-type ligase-like ATP-grasp enzyme
MILICGNIREPVSELVCARLEAENLSYRVFNLYSGDDPASRCIVNAHWSAGELQGGYFGNRDWQLDIKELSGVYFRPVEAPPQFSLQGLSARETQAVQAQRFAALSAVFDALPCPVVNRMSASMSNQSKPHQATLIRACGLSVPVTLITNDPAAADAFAAHHAGDVVYKSVSGLRSIVRRFGPELASRLPLLRHGPTQFQKRVHGADIRVHVVKDRIFATRIESQAVDYRYAASEGMPITIQPTELPPHVSESCVQLTRQLGLLFAGIDLKEAPEGEYVCFEANPSPGFLFYERATGQPISKALAQLLAGRPFE